MKKLFICALAVGMFTACSQDETISQQSPMQISFDGAFVENASRANVAADPSTTTETLEAFDVWAYMDAPTGKILENEDVTGTKGNFSYVNTQYWYAGHTYYFAALAPMNSNNVALVTPSTSDANKYGLGTLTFTNVDGTEDLLYAAYSRILAEDADLAKQEAVKFTFNHLLSKVKFSFKNTFTNPNISFVVNDIKMTVPNKGTIDLNQADWWTTNEWELETTKTDLAFGTTGNVAMGEEQECADERLTIPTDKNTFAEYTITFSIDLYNGAVLADTYNHEITLSGVNFEIGKAYDLVAELNASNIIDPDDEENAGGPYEIVFDVEEVKDWVAGDAAGIGQNVATEDELKTAVEKGGEIILADDITLSTTLNFTQTANLNLNGKILTNKVDNTNTDVIIVKEGATLTITGNGTVEAITGNDGFAVISEGELIINNGTFKSGVDANGEANAVIYARGKGKVYINGGTFPNDNNSSYVVNKKDADRSTTIISVTGGTFTNFNPADNKAEGEGTNFVPSGYVSKETTNGSNIWEVTAEEAEEAE